jgi:hypothetical protein
MSRELLQQALDALNTCDWDYDYDEESYKTFDEDLVNAAAAALEAELAKPEQWGDSAISDPVFLNAQRDINGAIRQLAKREWVGLTDIDIHVLKMNYDKLKVVHTDRAEDLTVIGQDVNVNALINSIQNKLKELNT